MVMPASDPPEPLKVLLVLNVYTHPFMGLEWVPLACASSWPIQEKKGCLFNFSSC